MIQIDENTLLEKNPSQGPFEDDFPFPKVGYTPEI